MRPLDSLTRATLRTAELGFLGFVVKTRAHTPLTCGAPWSAGERVGVGRCGLRAPRATCRYVTQAAGVLWNERVAAIAAAAGTPAGHGRRSRGACRDEDEAETEGNARERGAAPAMPCREGPAAAAVAAALEKARGALRAAACAGTERPTPAASEGARKESWQAKGGQ